MAQQSQYIPGAGSHLILISTLARRIGNSVEYVVELGCGVYSTPIWFNRALFPKLRSVISYEHNPEWSRRIEYLINDKRLHLVDVFPNTIDADLILIDNGPGHGGRIAGISHVCAQHPAGLVILHDAEERIYREVIDLHFDHIVNYTAVHPETALFWNGDAYSSALIIEWVAGIGQYE